MTNLAKLLTDNVNGTTFISIDTVTEPKLKGGKKNPFLGRVRKVMTGANVMIFQNKVLNGYEEMVRRRLTKEGKNPDHFRLSPRSWGVRVKDTPFVKHNDNLYLEVIFLHSGEVHYEVDGKITPADEIDGLDVSKEEGKQGGLNDKVIIRSFKTSNIRKIRVNKETYDIPTFEL